MKTSRRARKRITVSLVLLLGLFTGACDRQGDNSSRSDGSGAKSTTPAAPSPQDEENTAVGSLKNVAAELAQRFHVPEKLHPDAGDSQKLKLNVMVLTDNITARRTGDLIAPFKGEIKGVAALSIPGSWFNDHKSKDVSYDVVWPFTYREARWQNDMISVVPESEAAGEPTLSSLAEMVRMRVIMWDSNDPSPK